MAFNNVNGKNSEKGKTNYRAFDNLSINQDQSI